MSWECARITDPSHLARNCPDTRDTVDRCARMTCTMWAQHVWLPSNLGVLRIAVCEYMSVRVCDKGRRRSACAVDAKQPICLLWCIARTVCIYASMHDLLRPPICWRWAKLYCPCRCIDWWRLLTSSPRLFPTLRTGGNMRNTTAA